MVTSKAVLAIVCTVLNAARRPRERPDNGPYEFLLAGRAAPPGMGTNHPARPRSVAAIDVNKLKENIVIRCYFHEAQRARARDAAYIAAKNHPRDCARIVYGSAPRFDFIRLAARDYLFDDDID